MQKNFAKKKKQFSVSKITSAYSSFKRFIFQSTGVHELLLTIYCQIHGCVHAAVAIVTNAGVDTFLLRGQVVQGQ